MPSGHDQAGPRTRSTEQVIERTDAVLDERGWPRGSEWRVAMASHGHHPKFDALPISSSACEPSQPTECSADLPA